MLTKIILKTIIICSAIYLVHSKGCHDYLNELSNEQSHFVQCVTKNSVPVRMCTTCNDTYKKMLEFYDLISANCSDVFFDKDRINLIASTEFVLTGLWSKAYCDDCFNNNNIFVFNAIEDKLSKCFDDYSKDPCNSCKLQYLDLNNFYINIDQHNNGEVCYDLQDSMNATRNKWSKELSCCHRKQNLTLFILVLGITMCLPLIFYGTTFCITKRQERHQRILFNEDPYYSNVPQSSRRNIINGVSNQNQQTQSLIDNIPTSSNAGTSDDAVYNTPLASNNKNYKYSYNDTESTDDEFQINLTTPSKEKIKKCG